MEVVSILPTLFHQNLRTTYELHVNTNDLVDLKKLLDKEGAPGINQLGMIYTRVLCNRDRTIYSVVAVRNNRTLHARCAPPSPTGDRPQFHRVAHAQDTRVPVTPYVAGAAHLRRCRRASPVDPSIHRPRALSLSLARPPGPVRD
jgi:hypothetical protein